MVVFIKDGYTTRGHSCWGGGGRERGLDKCFHHTAGEAKILL